MDGIINVYKEKGYTSHDVVAKLRGILHQKKIGHTGTLDPDATGVLPVCLGRATKVCELLTDKKKTYLAVVRLGVQTDTQDLTGTIVEEKEVRVNEEQIRQTAASFLGEYEQIPPMYSAVKVNGKRLYELARQGREVERKARKVHIYTCDIREIDLADNEFSMEVTCSKGTYIRTLCQDIGEKLGCGAAMASLVRLQVDRFELEDALTLERIESLQKENALVPFILPVDQLFDAYDKVVVEDKAVSYLQNGNKINGKYCKGDIPVEDGKRVRMYDTKDRFYAIYRFDAGQNVLVNDKMFFPHTEA